MKEQLEAIEKRLASIETTLVGIVPHVNRRIAWLETHTDSGIQLSVPAEVTGTLLGVSATMVSPGQLQVLATARRDNGQLSFIGGPFKLL